MEINKVYNEDCLFTMSRINNQFVDFIITSPPYDDARNYQGFNFDFEKIAKEIFRILKNGRVLTWIVGNVTKNFCETLTPFKQAIYFVEECGFKLLDTMIYAKKGSPPQYPGLRRYPQRFEFIFVFSKGRPEIFHPIKDHKNKYVGPQSKHTSRQKDGSMRKNSAYVAKEYSTRGNIWTYDVGWNKDTKDKIALKHPARFPELLVYDCLRTWTNENDLVYDPFIGSGTTAKVCLLNHRSFIGSEISKEYCDLIEERLKVVK